VKIGCLAQLVNVIAPIMTDPAGTAWRQASFHPFALTARYGRGTVLQTAATSPVHETAEYGEVPLLDSVAVQSSPTDVVLFAVNRHQSEALSLEVDLRSLPDLTSASHTCVADENADAINTSEQPDRVTPRRLDDPKLDGGRLQAVLPPLSWNMIRIS
jgi:alpha-N-arabinofuranosidase